MDNPRCILLVLRQSWIVTLCLMMVHSSASVEPTFDLLQENVTVVAGNTAILPCSIRNLGTYKTMWSRKDDLALTLGDTVIVDDNRFSVQHIHMNQWNLMIRDVLREDQGQYVCVINTEPLKSKSVVLQVVVPAYIIDLLSSNDMTLQEGDTAIFVCNVTGVPPPEVTWYRRPTYSQINQREPLDNIGEFLIVKNVSRHSSEDTYECVADNGVPPAISRQMRLTVEFVPDITMPNRRIGQQLGRDTIIECIIRAFPQAVNYWEKDGERITDTGDRYRVEAYDEGDHTIILSLQINNLQETDFGEYNCVAKNHLGSDEESMNLYRIGDVNNDQNEDVNTDDNYITSPSPQHLTSLGLWIIQLLWIIFAI